MPAVAVLLLVSSVIQMTDAGIAGRVESLARLCQFAWRPSSTLGVLDTEGHDVPVHRRRPAGAESPAGRSAPCRLRCADATRHERDARASAGDRDARQEI